MSDILYQLSNNFRAVQPQTCGSYECSFEFGEVVRKAVEKARSYFDGLCLGKLHQLPRARSNSVADGVIVDCISLSHPKLADHDEDYWNHANLGVAWDDGCRVRHKQPSWYFSFMGRRQKMVTWTKTRGGGRGGGGQGYE